MTLVTEKKYIVKGRMRKEWLDITANMGTLTFHNEIANLPLAPECELCKDACRDCEKLFDAQGEAGYLKQDLYELRKKLDAIKAKINEWIEDSRKAFDGKSVNSAITTGIVEGTLSRVLSLLEGEKP